MKLHKHDEVGMGGGGGENFNISVFNSFRLQEFLFLNVCLILRNSNKRQFISQYQINVVARQQKNAIEI